MKIIDANGFLNIQKKNNLYTIINDASNIYYILLHDCYDQNSYLCREHIIDSYNIQELSSINN
jgi:hypothetical protein